MRDADRAFVTGLTADELYVQSVPSVTQLYISEGREVAIS